jgi:hypothetical protein
MDQMYVPITFSHPLTLNSTFRLYPEGRGSKLTCRPRVLPLHAVVLSLSVIAHDPVKLVGAAFRGGAARQVTGQRGDGHWGDGAIPVSRQAIEAYFMQ